MPASPKKVPFRTISQEIESKLKNWIFWNDERKHKSKYKFEYEMEGNKNKTHGFTCSESLIFWMLFTTIAVTLMTFFGGIIQAGSSFDMEKPIHPIRASSLQNNPIVANRILISIISNHDSCFGAIDTAIKHSYNPDRLTFIIANTNFDFDENNINESYSCLRTDSDIESAILEEYDETIHEIFVSEQGIDTAKAQITSYLMENKLLTDFDYILETHAHSLFSHYWDIEVLQEYNTAVSLNHGNTKLILTNYPSATKSISQREFDHNHGNTMNILCGTSIVDPHFNQGIIRYSNSWEIKPHTCHKPNEYTEYTDSQPTNKHNITHHIASRSNIRSQLKHAPFDVICEPLEIPFFSNLFSFSPINVITDIPRDPYLTYLNDHNGGEFLYSARLRTHGYKMYAPAQDVIFHSYQSPMIKNNKQKTKQSGIQNRIGMLQDLKRMKHILGIENKESLTNDLVKDDKLSADTSSSDINFQDIEKYGVGHEMELQTYLKLVGVDLTNAKTIQDKLCFDIREGRWHS